MVCPGKQSLPMAEPGQNLGIPVSQFWAHIIKSLPTPSHYNGGKDSAFNTHNEHLEHSLVIR